MNNGFPKPCECGLLPTFVVEPNDVYGAEGSAKCEECGSAVYEYGETYEECLANLKETWNNVH